MKKVYFFLVSLLFAFSSFLTQAQEMEQIINDPNGNPKTIKFTQGTKVSADDTKSLLLSYLPQASENDFILIKSEKDQLGMTHDKYQQYYNGIKVEYGTYTVNTKNGNPLSIIGQYFPVKESQTKSSQISEEQALQKALDYIGAEVYMWESEENEEWAKEVEPTGTFYPQGELVYIKDYFNEDLALKNQLVLVYKFNIYAQKPLSRDYVYVNAETGEIVFKDAIIKLFPIEEDVNGTSTKSAQNNSIKSGVYAATRYSGVQTISTTTSGSNYVLKAYDRGNGIETYNIHNSTSYWSAYDFTDNNNQWTADEFDNAAKDNAALDAHWGTEKVWDYWMLKRGRNSYDANKGVIKNYVHYGSNSDEAFWNGNVFSYGDGNMYDAVTSLDAVAYAIGHAICDNTADLTYYGESGAITEGLSNIWAACVDNYAAIGKSVWEIGEDIGGPIFNLSNPNAHGQPDTYLGTYWINSTSNNEFEQKNSGVLGYWFYLLSEGGSGTNDNGHAYNVSGIGIEDAARVTYRAEAIYLNPDDQYSDLRTVTIVAAEDIFGAGSNESDQVKNAWDAVGVYALQQGSSDYCDSYCLDSYYMWLREVNIGGFTNTSGRSTYTDFTFMELDLEPGVSYPVHLIQSGQTVYRYQLYWRIWIDLNGDNDFDDANELVFDSSTPFGTDNTTGSMTLPETHTKTTRMRVSIFYAGYGYKQGPCDVSWYGEVEDYTVNIFNPEAPTAPANLTEVSKSQTSVNLAWDASTDNVEVIGYKIYQDGIEVKDVPGTSATVDGLSAQTSYLFYVVAYDGDDNLSPKSNMINVVTKSNYPNDTQAPTAPQSLNYNNVTKSSVGLNWNASTDNIAVAGYFIYQDGVKVASVNTTNITINGLSSETGYSFYVKAFDAAGNVSDASNTANVTTLSDNPEDNESPTVPTNLTASDIGKTSLKLTWDASSDNVGVDYYRIYRNGSHISSVNNTSSLITGLTEGAQYYFYIRAYDEAGNSSSNSSWLWITTESDSDNESPTTPQNIQVVDKGTDYVQLSWDPSSDNLGVTQYRVYKNGSSYTYVNGTSVIVEGLNAGTEYYFQVRAYDAANNNSGLSSRKYVTTDTEGYTPEGITFPSYTCFTYGNDQSYEFIDYVGLGVIDNASGAEAGYSSYLGTITPAVLSPHSYILYLSAGFASGRDNEYWRVWIDFNMDGDFYDEDELVAEGGPFAYDGIISAEFVVPTSISAGYTVMRVSMKYGGYPSSCEIFQYGEVEDYPIELSNGKSGNYTSDMEHSNTRDINNPIGIERTLLYPNPVSNTLYINNISRDSKLQNVSVYSSTGALVIQQQVNDTNNEVNVSELPSGIYTIAVKTDRKVYNSKFIKQ